MKYTILAFFVFGLFSLNHSYAEETLNAPVIPKPLNVMPSKIKPVQSGTDELSKAAPENNSILTDLSHLDSLSPLPMDGFQNDFWNGLSWTDLKPFLMENGTLTASKSVRNLSIKALLSSGAPKDKLPESEEGLYAHRLNKLVDLGNFKDAQSLYKLNEAPPPSSLAARAGIESTLGQNNIAVACLDQKTFTNTLKTNDPQFWKNLDLFCQTLLSPAAGDDDELRLENASRAYLSIVVSNPKTTADINELDIVTTIALLKSGFFERFFSNSNILKEINDKHLALFLNYMPHIETSFTLLKEGIRRGIIDDNSALAFIKSIIADGAAPFYGDYFRLYEESSNLSSISPELLSLARSDIMLTLLLPLYAQPKMAYPEEYGSLTLRSLALTNQKLPEKFVRKVLNLSEYSSDNSFDGESILIDSLLGTDDSSSQLSEKNQNPLLLALKYANYPQKHIKSPYDNIYSLTESGNYVMHSDEELSTLIESASKKQMNRVVIRSLKILDDKPLDKINPAVFYQILEALNSAGLTEETMSLTREVLGNLIKINK